MIRHDLAFGFIAGENDYTSNLTSTIRRQINGIKRVSPSGLSATSFVLQPKTERKIGCDAAIILANNKAQEFKVCCFEAKLPRLKTPKKSWDSKQQKIKLSHFSEQIKKQTHVSNKFAVWEMFYCEYDFKKQPSFMNDRKSSCIWHQDAYAKVQEKGDSNKWTNTDLQNLLTRVTYQTGIDDMVRDVCECKQGELIKGSDYVSIFDEYGFPRNKNVLLIQFSET
jgi:hypothetical protein